MISVILETVSTIFFFQAEDGIRDLTVTGVHTSALPILTYDRPIFLGNDDLGRRARHDATLQNTWKRVHKYNLNGMSHTLRFTASNCQRQPLLLCLATSDQQHT